MKLNIYHNYTSTKLIKIRIVINMYKIITFKNKKIIIFILIIVIFSYFISIQFSFKQAQNANEIKENNYHIFVDVEESKMYVFEKDNLTKIYECAGGKTETPSPIGTWQISFKALWGEGYGGRFMGLNCPWGQFGIHGTPLENSVGTKSSHGCIRMKIKDVEELYSYIPIGTKVTIVDGPYGSFSKGFRTITPGMYGADVYEIQKKLKQMGIYEGELNGILDLKTEQAVKEYCKKNGLKVTKIIDEQLQKHMGFILIE